MYHSLKLKRISNIYAINEASQEERKNTKRKNKVDQYPIELFEKILTPFCFGFKERAEAMKFMLTFKGIDPAKLYEPDLYRNHAIQRSPKLAEQDFRKFIKNKGKYKRVIGTGKFEICSTFDNWNETNDLMRTVIPKLCRKKKSIPK
jgi:hypothetical protein